MARSLLTETYGADRVTLIRKSSVEALGHFRNGSLDFINIDARRDFCSVTEDLDNYWPKLKGKGLYAGDDYGFDHGKGSTQDWTICADGRLRETRCARLC